MYLQLHNAAIVQVVSKWQYSEQPRKWLPKRRNKLEAIEFDFNFRRVLGILKWSFSTSHSKFTSTIFHFLQRISKNKQKHVYPINETS